MKLLALVLASTFAVPAFGMDIEKQKTVAEKNQTEIKNITFNLKHTNAEEMKDKSEQYRIKEIADPNDKVIGQNIKNWKVQPTAFSDRRAIMTPEEKRREDESAYPGHPENGKHSTFTGSEKRPTNFGVKVKLPFGASR